MTKPGKNVVSLQGMTQKWVPVNVVLIGGIVETINPMRSSWEITPLNFYVNLRATNDAILSIFHMG